VQEPHKEEGAAHGAEALPGFWGDIIRTINWTFVINVVQFFVLLFLLKLIIFDPVIQIVRSRQDKIGLNLARAEQQRLEAKRLKEQREQQLAAVGAQARHLVEEARRQSDRIMQERYRTARAEGQQIIEKAKQEAETERAQLRKELERELTGFAAMSAAKLLGRDVEARSP
jgi:F-type H+-transporting ATPase subunit b